MPDTLEPIAAPSAEALVTADWPDTDLSLLEEGRPSLPDFPLDSLPPWWRTWTSEAAHASGAPVDYIAQALLAAVAGVCGSGVVARLTDSWDEPLILWQVLVGGPSNGKTPALATLRRALAAVEKTTERDGRGPTVVAEDMPFPKLLALARKRPAGALLWRDEPAAWLAALGCNGRGEPRQVGALLDAWSPLRTALGPGSPAISMIGCLDPARLGEALSAGDDGRGARFLYVWPPPPPWRGFLDRPGLRESDAVNALQHIARIAGDPAAPLALAPDGPALKILDEHLARLHRELQRSQAVEAAWLGKGPATVARLAAALALLAWAANASSVAPPPTTIAGETMSAACRLWDYFRSHARAVLARASPTGGAPLDSNYLRRRVLAWIRLHGVAEVSREDVRRDALGQALNAGQTLDVIRSLERAGFLRRIAHEPDGPGRPPLRWDVNPVVIGASGAEIAEIAEITLPSVLPERGPLSRAQSRDPGPLMSAHSHAP
jgi:hypothetical protein